MKEIKGLGMEREIPMVKLTLGKSEFTTHDSLRSIKIIDESGENFKPFVNMSTEEQIAFEQAFDKNWEILQEGESPINPEEVMFEPKFLFVRSTNSTGPKFEISVWKHEVERK